MGSHGEPPINIPTTEFEARREDVVDTIANIPNANIIIAISLFQQHVQTIITFDGGFNELCYPLCMRLPVQNVKM